MSRGRVLLVVLFLCSLSAFGQDEFLPPQKSNPQPTPDLRTPPAATRSEPWRILPKADLDQNPLTVAIPQFDSQGMLVVPGDPRADTTCFAIRSYVVARDSQDSDSVHPVGYTTCVPAAKARLRTADAHVELVR